ncbi:MAG TPA: hypothetical protein VML54_08835, partial [Candidatus Limnocylindrales bacterium]|nr:hypothetical protein [Candidatus Limnocylindrales bacterium]
IVVWGPRMGERHNAALLRGSAAGGRIASRPEDLSERLGRTVLMHIEREWDFASYEDHGDATPGLDPEIASLVQAFHSEHRTLQRQLERTAATAIQAFEAIGISDTACEQAEAITNRSLAEIQPAVARYRAAARQLYQVAHERSTGLAANLSDSDYHETALANVETGAISAQLGVETRVMAAFQVMSVTGGCDPGEDAEEEEDDEGPAPKAPRCPRSLSGAGLEMKFGKFLTVAIDCEKLKAGLSSGGGIGPFLDLEWGMGPGGKLTIFGGSSASADAGGVSAGFKSGIYLTVADGSGVEDFGWRSGPSVSVSAGGGTVSPSLEAVDLSFVNIF